MFCIQEEFVALATQHKIKTKASIVLIFIFYFFVNNKILIFIFLEINEKRRLFDFIMLFAFICADVRLNLKALRDLEI